MILNIIGLLIILVVLVGAFLVQRREKRNWNKGYCSDCGTKWTFFSYDSHGDIGYYCTKCNRYIWISYNVDKYK